MAASSLGPIGTVAAVAAPVEATASASSVRSGFPASLAIDGDPATFWLSAPNEPGAGPTIEDPTTFTVEYPAVVTVQTVIVSPRIAGANGTGSGPKSFHIEAMVDGVWVPLASVATAPPKDPAVVTVPVTQTRAVRLIITAAYDNLYPMSARNVSIAEFVIEGSPPPDDRPIVFVTDDQLDQMRLNVAEKIEPAYSSWLKVESEADRALTTNYEPTPKGNAGSYFYFAKAHAQDVRNLALAWEMTQDSSYLTKAKSILTAWASNANSTGQVGAQDDIVSQGLVLGRAIPIFADGYALLYSQLSVAERTEIRTWFTTALGAIRNSREHWRTTTELCTGSSCNPVETPWINHQEGSNHLGAQNLGVVAIGYALKDESIVAEGLDDPSNPKNLKELIDDVILMSDADAWERDGTITAGMPSVEPGEIWDRIRTGESKGLHYTHIHLRFLTLQAEMATNNNDDVDWFDYVGPDGENLRLPFEFYSEFLLTGDSSARTGYYENSFVDYSMLSIYEIAMRHYPESSEIHSVLEKFTRNTFDLETFGWTLPLTHGTTGIAASTTPVPERSKPEWFMTGSDSLAGWRVANGALSIADGAARITLNHRDPQLISPAIMEIDTSKYTKLEFRIRNGADPASADGAATGAGTYAELYFGTEIEPGFSASRVVQIPIELNADEFVTYTVDLSTLPSWKGRIFQLRFDPTQSATVGRVDISYLRLVADDSAGVAVALTPDPIDEITFGSGVNLSVSLDRANALPFPSGDVAFTLDSEDLSVVEVVESEFGPHASTSITERSLRAGEHELTARYGGSPVYGEARAAWTIDVARDIVDISASLSASLRANDDAVLSVALAARNSHALGPDGTLVVRSGGGEVLASVPLGKTDDWLVDVPITLPDSATDLHVQYTNDANRIASDAVVHVDDQEPPAVATSVVAVPSKVFAKAGSAVKVSGQISAADGTEPVGTVTIMEGNQIVATTEVAAGDSGRFKNMKLPKLGASVHVLTVVFDGAEGYAHSQSVPIAIVLW